MRFDTLRIAMLAFVSLTACGPEEDDSGDNPPPDAELDAAVDMEVDAEPDAFIDPYPSCDEIKQRGEPCEVHLAPQPNGLTCIIEVQENILSGELCYLDGCGFGLGGNVELEPGWECKMLPVGETEDGTPMGCACFTASVSGDSPFAATDTRECAPRICQ